MKQTKPVERAWANLALLVALGTVLVAVVRVYWWSGFYVPVALSVLSVADRTALLASTLLLVVIALVPLLLSELLFSPSFNVNSLFKPDTPPLTAAKNFAVVIGVLIALFGFSSLVILLTVGGILALFAVGWFILIGVRWARHGRAGAGKLARARPFAEARLRHWPTFILTSGLLLVGALGQPWVPLERIEVGPESTTMVGYLVGAQHGFSLILDQKQTPSWVATDSIAERQLCARNYDDMWSRSIADLLSPTILPVCPEPEGLAP